MVPAKEQPFNLADEWKTLASLQEIGTPRADYDAMLDRFVKTFAPDASAPGGGDITFNF